MRNNMKFYLVLLLAALHEGSAYITSPGAVPINRQQQWLRVSTISFEQNELNSIDFFNNDTNIQLILLFLPPRFLQRK